MCPVCLFGAPLTELGGVPVAFGVEAGRQLLP